MNYYVVETDKHKLIQKTAGVKARQDVETIFKWNNFKKIEIPCLIEGRENKTRLGKIKAHYDVYMLWKNALKKIKKNDWIYIQFPLLEHTMLFSLLIKNLEKRGIHTSIIIHDVEAIRFTLRNDVPLSRKIRMRFEEISSFKNCSKIIVHNEKMKSFMHEKWKIHKDKMDILGIFDYLVENYNEELLEKRNLSRKGPVIIAGALSKHKAGYIYNLPENCNFNLYGINFEREKASSNTNYVGAFNPCKDHGLLRSLLHILVDPGTVLTDICDLHHIWIQAGLFRCFTESCLMHTRRTGTDNHSCEIFFTDGFLDPGLSCFRTHILIIFCMDNSWLFCNDLHNLFHVYRSGNITSAMTDKYTDSLHFLTSCIF